MIRDRIVYGTLSDDVRQRLLHVKDLSLDKAISLCRADAESKQSSQYLTENSDRVHLLRKSHSSQRTLSKGTKQSAMEHVKQPCGSCGLRHPRKQCPAYGKQCRKCNKFNHSVGPPAQLMQLNRMKIQILETVSIHYSLEPLPVKQRLQMSAIHSCKLKTSQFNSKLTQVHR